jgi:hypothetical protein
MARVNPIPLPVVPPPGGRSGGLAEKVVNALVSAVVKVVSLTLDPFAHAIRFAIETTLEDLESEMVAFSRPLLTELRRNEALPDSIKRTIDSLLNPTHPVQLAALVPLIGAVIIAIVMAAVAAILAIIQYAANRVTKPFRLPINVTWLAKRRGLGDDKINLGDLYDIGWNDERIGLANDVQETRLDAGAIGQLVLRGEMSQAQMVDELYKQGWKREHVEQLAKLLAIIPSPNDLIAMAVKEAWDDTFAATAGTDSEFPADFATWAQKQGLSSDWCKRYWRAHWQLPSAGQGFEMFHRGIITERELDQLLKALDISPAWRSKLRGITYNVYTRVDVRRLYNKNILTRDQVKQNYLALGYDNDHAENLTAFTVKDATGTDTEATKTDVLAGYSTGLLTKQEAIDWLKELDYPADLAEFYIAKEDAKREQARKSKRIASVQRLYIGGDITSPEASARLTGLGLTGNEISTYLDDWKIERDAKTEKPSPGQLETLLKQDIITEADYRSGLLSAGWQDKYVAWLTASVLKEKTDAANTLVQRQRLEQERLRTAKAKSTYAVDKSVLDSAQAEAQLAIAETQVALSELTTQYNSDLAIAKGIVSIVVLQQNAAKDVASLQVQIDDASVTAKSLAEGVNTENQAIAELNVRLAQRKEEVLALAKTSTDEVAITAATDELKAYTLNVNTLIAQHRLVVAQVQGDIAVNATKVDDLRAQIDQRKATLAGELGVAARVKSVDDLTRTFNASRATYTETLVGLRQHVSYLNLQKAKLAQTLQASLKVGG